MIEQSRINPEMSNQIADGLRDMDLNSPTRVISNDSLAKQSSNEMPHLSPFPRLVNPPPNVPPSDDELEARLESARMPVLNSNDPEMQLAWAQDALVYVGVCGDEAERVAASKPHSARASTPRIEHQLKTDAMNIVTFLADQHHPKAEFLRGMWLEWGRFGQREDKKEAFRCYSRAADKGYARADYRIGMLYESYNDPIKALRHYNRGVDAGDAASSYRLGMMTLRGQHGQPQDFTKALDLIKKSAEAADENAAQGAYVYGMLLSRQLPQIDLPEGVLPYDERLARINIEKAAYMKFAKAQAKMGSCYELGALGCEFNPALSMHYNALAAKQGEADAEMSLSKWFLVGSEGLFPKNEELAYTYAERASQSSLPTAEFALGYFSEIGMYVPVDLDKALEWYQKAARHGNEDAKGRIEGLSKKQVLSKNDHENVALSRIKSQHGSMRGNRPERFRQQQTPRLGQIGESSAGYITGGNGNATNPPPRTSSTTPYPLDDRPPTAPAATNRLQSTTPYPLEDNHLRPLPLNSPPRQGMGPVGGFFNGQPLRPATTVNPDMRPSSAFQINPEIRSNSTLNAPNVSGAQRPYPNSPSMGHGPPSWDHAGSPQPLDPRRRPIPARVASGPANVQDFHPQQGGPPPPMPGHLPHQSTAPAIPPKKIDIGYAAPYDDRRTRYGPSRQDHPRVSSANNTPNMSQPSQFDRMSQQPASSRPSDPRRPQNPGSSNPPPKTSSTSKPPNNAPSVSSTPSSAQPKPHKGPKTFDEMGVPAQSKDSECVSLSANFSSPFPTKEIFDH